MRSITGSSHTSFMHEISLIRYRLQKKVTASIITGNHVSNIVKKGCLWLKVCLLLPACQSAETGLTGCDWFDQCSTGVLCVVSWQGSEGNRSCNIKCCS